MKPLVLSSSLLFACVDSNVGSGRGHDPGRRDPACSQGSVDVADSFWSTSKCGAGGHPQGAAVGKRESGRTHLSSCPSDWLLFYGGIPSLAFILLFRPYLHWICAVREIFTMSLL